MVQVGYASRVYNVKMLTHYNNAPTYLYLYILFIIYFLIIQTVIIQYTHTIQLL